MDFDNIRAALGQLQVDPDSTDAWSSLEKIVLSSDSQLDANEVVRVLGSAAARHRERGEWEAVAALFDLQARVVGAGVEAVRALAELARVRHDHLVDQDGADAAYRHLLELDPDHAVARAALRESEERRTHWLALASTYLGEADKAQDDVYRSSMLMRSAEMQLRYAGGSADLDAIIDRLSQAVRLDSANVTAALMLERLLRRQERDEEAVRVLERIASQAESPVERVRAGVRVACLYARRLDDKESAAQAYQLVLNDAPNHPDAMEYLSSYYSAAERWQDLVTLYEKELAAKDMNSIERLGDMLQIAMLCWKKLDSAKDAEPWFERIRQLDAAHEGMLEFFREYCAVLGDDARLLQVLQGAQRVMKDGPQKAAVAAELARLAEGQANAQKAIEQYKGVLRQDADNVEAREALKRLYKATQGYNALVELLRQELERTEPSNYEKRLAILREVATVYRQYIKSDTALVSVLHQIVQLDDKLDEHDVLEMRELVALYAKLGRWRDLLLHQTKLAEITPDIEEKKQLYRDAARRWLDQFSNFQNATEAYEALLAVAPDDSEAAERLQDLYRKRRAWPALYALLTRQLETVSGSARLALMFDMAQLAAERLGRGDEAARLYREILDRDPSRREALDALERHAERVKDWAMLAEALERRARLADDAPAQINVLQKLGIVYSDHLEDSVEAARTWQRVLELQPGHHRALRVLRDSYLEAQDYDAIEKLYTSQNDWEGLADVLSNAADRARDNQTKIDLSYRAARVFEVQLGQPDRAFRSYERVLGSDPSDARAARALIPLYEKDEKWARLPPLYELLVQRSEDEQETLELLFKLVNVTGQMLSDRRTAVRYARRAYELAPLDSTAMETFEASARAAAGWDVFVEALELRLQQLSPAAAPAESTEEEVQRGKRRKKGKKRGDESPPDALGDEKDLGERRTLTLTLARVYDAELGKADAAIAALRGLLSVRPGDADAVSALEAILRRDNRRDDLRWLLELRVSSAPDDAERLSLLKEWAVLEEETFESSERAIELYQRVLGVDAGDLTALVALPRLLLAADDPGRAALFIEQHRAIATGAQRNELDIELAELYLVKLGRPADALEAAVRGLDFQGGDPRALSVVERLLDHEETRAAAARVLATRFATGGEARREAQALEVMLEQATEEGERIDLYLRLAAVHEQKLSSVGIALDVLLRAVREYPHRIELWDRAEVLAQVAGRPTDLADALREALRGELTTDSQRELCQRAAQLHEERLGDPMGAIPYLEKMVSAEPDNDAPFRKLKDILTGSERWAELEALYDTAAARATDLGRRAEMLVEVALICEEIIEDPAKATGYYERILDLDPSHSSATQSLDRLYTRQKRHADLADLLSRRLDTAAGEEVLELKLRLARIQLHDLHEPEKAIGYVDDVLSERPGDYDARELAERLLEIEALRGRAARMLEAVYESRDQIRDLVRVLQIRLDALPPAGAKGADEDERAELLRRIARLRDERLHDDRGALESFALLVPVDPIDTHARDRLLDIGKRLGEHEHVAQVLTTAADVAHDPGVKGEILTRVARIYQDSLHDVARAESTYRRVLVLDENAADLVLPAARALRGIYESTGQNEELADVLRTEVRLEQNAETRCDLLGKLGELCQSVLGDAKGAIQAWETRVDEDPNDAEALAALDRLYARTEAWQEAATVLERRMDLAENKSLRRELMVRLATLQNSRLSNPAAAIDTWNNLIGEFGADPESLGALEALYRDVERWSELADAYEQHLGLTLQDSERLALLASLGQVRSQQLGDLVGALDMFRSALALDASYAPARQALDAMLESHDPLTRVEVAKVLRPIYENDADHENLLRVLQIEIEASDDPAHKLEGLERAMNVAEAELRDGGRALDYAMEAVRVAAGHADLEPWLGRVDRLARVSERQQEQVELLRAVASDIMDGEVQLSVLLKIAELSRYRLGDMKLAREYYEKALEVRVDDRRALIALQSLHEETGDTESLLSVLERRVDCAENDDERKALMFQRGELLADTLKDPVRAIPVYEAILDMGPDPVAVSALGRLYQDEKRWSDLIDLHVRQLDAPGADAADLHVKIAEVAARHLKDVGRALDELEQALDVDRQRAGAVTELERLLAEASDPEHRARAATLLEPVYLLATDFKKLMGAIEARLECTSARDERRELLSRLSKLYDEQAEDYLAALETTAKLLHEDLSDTDTQAELERLAKVAGAEKRLAEIYEQELADVTVLDPNSAALSRRTGEILASLGELEKALGFYRRSLEFEPDNRALFQAVDGLLVRMKRPDERVALQREILDHRFEPEERLQILHTIAEVQRQELGQADDAIDTYVSALEVEPSDLKALEALTELYREKGRWTDLADLYLRRVESAKKPNEEAEYRLLLAQLYRDKLSDPQLSIDQLEEIVRGQPTHRGAIEELEKYWHSRVQEERVIDLLRPLYEGMDDWRSIVALNESRYHLATDALEKVTLLRENAALLERRARDAAAARKALAAAVQTEPDDSDVRVDYERLVEATGAWGELANTYEQVLRARPTLSSQRELLVKIAEVHDSHRDDPRRALEAYARLHAADDTDLAPLEKMEKLATLLSDWRTLVDVLSKMADLVSEDELRASLWRRVGEAKRDMLEDPLGAIDAYARAYDIEPDSTFTVDCLIELHEQAGDPDRLVELCQRRVDLTEDEDADLKYDLLMTAAKVLEERIGDRIGAIESLNRALVVKPADNAVLGSLNRLCRAEQMWPELLDNLRVQVGIAQDAAERVRLRHEIATVLADKQQLYLDALEVYRELLSEVPSDAGAVVAVRAIGSEHEELREVMAGILVPVLRLTERHQDLVEVLEMRLSVETEPGQRAATLRDMAQVQEQRLGTLGDALGSLLRAMGEQPEDREVHAEAERLAAPTEGWGRYADALTERAQSTFDPDIARELYAKLGELAEQRLDDPQRAVEAYNLAVQQAGDQPELLEALDRLHTRLGDAQALSEVLERRVLLLASDTEQADACYRLAVVQLRDLREPARALASLRTVLERAPGHADAARALEKLTEQPDLFEEAADALEPVYRSSGQTDRLAALYEKRVQFASDPAERIQRQQNLARVLEEECRDAPAAQRVLERAIGDDPSDAVLLGELERLASVTGDWRGAAHALTAAIGGARDLAPDMGRELCVRLAGWLRDRAADREGAEKALVSALGYEPNSDEVLEQLEDLQRVSGREAELVATLRRRASLQMDEQRRVDLYREAKNLAEAQGDAALEEAVLRELIEHDSLNLWALGELARLRQAAGDYAEALRLLLQRAELVVDGNESHKLRHEAALLARERLADANTALKLYEALFEDEPNDRRAADALRDLYAQTERYDNLAHLLERLTDLADAVEERSVLRLEIASLQQQRFQDPDAAVDVLRMLLDEDPNNAEAVVALSTLYEKTGRDEDLASLLSSRIEAAQARRDTEAELKLQVRLGEVCESRLGDPARAIATYRSVLVRDPEHRGALEALARLCRGAGDHAEAAGAYERLLELSSGEQRVAVALELADEYDQLDDASGSIRALERGLHADERNAKLRARLQTLYESGKQWDKLAGLLVKNAQWLEDPAQKVKLLRAAADIHSTQRSDPAAAAELLDRASQLKPDDRDILLALCDAYNASGRGRAAAEVLEKVVQSYGGKRTRELGELHRRLADAYLAMGENRRAVEELDKTFRIEPGNVHVLKKLGELALEMDDLKKAQQMFRALLLQRLDQTSPISKAEVFMGLGEVHRRLGEKPKAVQMYERALQQDPTLEQAKQRLVELRG
ncbi:MAG: tetratricopeptide repeat protein [Polyangiaceae bacterium]|nr:tetratricopeptide repeat protein [Polyangiaceae bacterium]